MTVYKPTLPFITPPRNQGQAVTVSYATDDHSGVIIERHEDETGATTYCAYEWIDEDFEPWNCVPRLGNSLGECEI